VSPRLDVDEDLFNCIVSDGQQTRSGGLDASFGITEFDDYLFGVCNRKDRPTEPLAVDSTLPLEAELFGGLAGSESSTGEEEQEYEAEGGEFNDHHVAPTAEAVEAHMRTLTTRETKRAWRDYSGKCLQSRCFAVEWRGSSLLDKDMFTREVFRAEGPSLS